MALLPNGSKPTPARTASIVPEPGKELCLHPSYLNDSIARSFWRASFRAGRDYTRGLDAMGGPVIWTHQREDPDNYARRKQTTKGAKFVGPIIRQFNDFAFRKPANREEGDNVPELYAQLRDDVDGHGTSLQKLMRRSLLMGQIEREAYLMPANTAPAGLSVRNVAEARSLKIRPVIKRIGADDVVNWTEVGGVLSEAVVVLTIDGAVVARYMNSEIRRDYPLERIDVSEESSTVGAYRVGAPGADVAHGYGALPLVRHRPQFDDLGTDNAGDGQAGPIAELQQAHWNYLSLADEELFNNAFSQFWIAGSSKPDAAQFKFGSDRVLFFSDPAATLNRLAGDPIATDVIEKAMARCVTNLYRAAGLESADPTVVKGGIESGLAKAFKFQNLAAILSSLVDSCEEAENAVMHLIETAWGFEMPKDTEYPDDFDIPDYDAELTALVTALATSAMPATLKAAAVDRFVARNLNLSDEEQEELDGELEEKSAQADAATSAFPPSKAESADADGEDEPITKSTTPEPVGAGK